MIVAAGGTVRATLSRHGCVRRDEVRGLKAAKRVSQATCRMVPRGLSHLEAVTVNTPSVQDYRHRLSRFVEWARVNGCSWIENDELDMLLCEYFDLRFFEGRTADEGAKIWQALRSSCRP